MNFIVIVSDTFRRDHAGCYGNRWISTPHLDAFARTAQVFENAYSASFPTVPNRRDLMTGCFTAAYTGWAPMTEKETVLSQVLSAAGYATAMVTDCPHILENGYYFDRGFQSWEWIRGQESDRWKTHPRRPKSPCDPKKIRGAANLSERHRRAVAARRYESDTFVAQTMTRACEWLEDNYRDGPFFLYTDTFDPHEPWDAPPWYVERYNPGYTGEVVDYPHYAMVEGYLSPEELNHCRALYAAEVTLVDRWTGRLLQKISDLNLLDDTLVLFTTDHGFLLGEHGIIGKGLLPEPGQLRYIPLYEEISHIPFIIHVPGGSAGRRRAVVQPQDIMPTILELAGVPVPETVNGRSFAGVVRGGPDRHRDFAVSAPFIGMETVFATVWKGDWAAMLRPGRAVAGAKHADKAIDGYAKLEDAAGLREELLFDMAADPGQARNLAPERPGVMAELRADLMGYFESARADKKFIEAWREPPAKK